MAFFMLAWTSLSAEESVSVEDSATADFPLDSIDVSILTCTPGKDMYAKFGHTALRVRDYTAHRDIVFNYGCFDYNANNFVLKFLLGQTDYLLDAEEFEFLKYRYGRLGNGVSEQVLNLSKEEANTLLILLLENLRPENQEYRYNWLYDNCTERARDVIEKAVDGKIEYAGEVEENVTVRDMLHKCLEQSPWVAFGIDLILGAEIDGKADKRIMMFLPDVFRTESDGAYIVKSNGERVKYIAGRSVVLEDKNGPDEAYMLGTPLFLFSMLLLCAIGLSLKEFKKNQNTVWLDVTMHIFQGIAGLVVAFLFFFSIHPAVDSNWLVILFNPLPLFYAGWMLYCHKKGIKNMLSYVNLAVILGFLVVMCLCPQSFNIAMWLVVFSLLVRAMVQAHFAYHGSKQSNRIVQR
ncbi:MAG: DUF4105 domain-containing protein [Bacteroidaceae bacterium]|nr:DUF4105 domain-containing protein [Bacteroidaceae bacterium]